MALKSDKNLKLYYSIREVAEMFDVNEFPIIAPKKAGGNIRQYTKEDIENIRLVYHLVKEKKMTLAGARQRLKQNKESIRDTAEIIDRLRRIKEDLLSMRKELDYLT